MEVLLVSGFLGAGKTTLINHFLKSRLEGIGKVAVIVNEVGKLGIDGTLLSGTNVNMVELTSGCICCTIKTGFLKAVQEIYDRVHPDFLVVEATGVAQPGDILDILLDAPVKDFCRVRSLVTVVDAGFFSARDVLGIFYDNQIRLADMLILNKVDQVDHNTMEEIRAVLQEMNPGGLIVTARYCSVEPSVLLGITATGEESSHEAGNGHGEQEVHHHLEAGFQTFSFESERTMERDKLVHFLDSLPPTLFRLKGWVRFPDASVFLDFTGGRYRMEPVDNSRSTALAFVGRNCNETEILDALKDCLKKEPTEP